MTIAAQPGVAATHMRRRRPRLRRAPGRVSRTVRRLLPPVLSVGTALVAWQVLAGLEVLPLSASSPAAIFEELRAESATLWSHAAPTISVAAQGYLVAVAVAVTLSLLTVLLPGLTESVLRVAVVTYSLPLIALAPILVVWLGIGTGVRVTIAAIAGFFPILVGCIQGFRRTDAGHDELFAQLASSRTDRFRLLVLPGSMPYVFAGLKISGAAAVLGAIIAEWTGAEVGLGVLMTLAMFSFDPPMVWLSMLASSALSLCFYGTVAGLERLVVRWDVDRDAVAGAI
jgi:NitT/TauT family transport system permease protein